MWGNKDQFGTGGVAMRRSGFRIWPLLLFAIFGVMFYFSNREVVPVTGRKHVVGLSEDQERMLGIQSYREVLSGMPLLSEGPEVQRVRSVGQRLAKVSEKPAMEWEFNVVRDESVNAFCLPGGKVAVFTGILPVAQNDDGLAVVMGHEIAHAIARHGAERMAHEQLLQFGTMALGVATGEMDMDRRRAIMGAFGLGAQFGAMLPFSRKHESEADYIGLMYVARACFDPREAPKFWERMDRAKTGGQPPEFVSTHPSGQTRVAQLQEWMPDAMKERGKYCN